MGKFPPTFPEFDLGDYRLRALEPRDAEDFHKIMSDAEVLKTTSFEPMTLAQIEQWIARLSAMFKSEASIHWALVDKKTDRMVGHYAFLYVYEPHSRAEVGYNLAKEHWNKGITTRVLELMLDFGFRVLQVNRIEATVMAGNMASARVLEKFDFKNEGTLRDFSYCRGEFHDYWKCSLLRREWLARK